jgi:serpin B
MFAPSGRPDPLSPLALEAADASNRFAFSLYRQIGKEPGNLFFSPASLSIALAMTSSGAADPTLAEMQSVLQLDAIAAARSPSDYHQAIGELTRLLNEQMPEYQLNMANRLWGQRGYKFLPEFLALTSGAYQAELAQLDFGNSEAAREQINQWVSSKTEGKIPDLIPSGSIEPDTRLVLTNAIYFLGRWQTPFEKDLTGDEPFWLSDDTSVDVPLMHAERTFRYTEDDEVQVLELPYLGHALSMLVILPRSKTGLSSFEAGLNSERLNHWVDQLMPQEVRVSMPKFRASSRLALAKALGGMGMPSAFSDAADFSRMSSVERLKISAVVHQAFVDVDEEGTEAAAATGVIMGPTAMLLDPQEPLIFRADHPCLFLIRDDRSGLVLFMGRLSDPRAVPN